MTSKAKATKDKLDFIKIKDFYASKDSIKEAKRKPTEWEETTASYIWQGSSTQQT